MSRWSCLVIIKTFFVCLLVSQAAAQLTITPKETTLRIEESDGRVAREEALTPPAAARGSLRLDHTETLKVAFTVVTESGEAFRPQQAVVRLTSGETGAAAYFAAKRNKDGSLSTSITSAAVEKQLGSQGGLYEAVLLLGDTRTAAPLEWRLAQLTVLHSPLDDGSQPAGPPPRAMELLARPQPEITHLHRPPTRRVPAPVALAASAACVAPLGLLLFLLGRLGANLKGFPSGPAGLWSLLFQGGLAAILGLYVLFWLRLNLLQTLPVLAVLGVFTAGAGNRALSSLAQSRKKQS
ncbi:hypothetical protein N2152v2_003139 [Parachlorella kessleri]